MSLGGLLGAARVHKILLRTPMPLYLGPPNPGVQPQGYNPEPLEVCPEV